MQYDLVFEGGGAKGMVFVGAMQAFEAAGHTHGRLLGTSAGAITAALLAAGYTAEEMQAALVEKLPDGHSVFSGFLGMPAPFDPAAIRNSELRAALRAFNVAVIPDFIEEKLDDQLVDWLAAQSSFRHVFSFIERGGWYGADSFISWLQHRLDTGAYKGAPRQFSALTLEKFYEATQTDLSLVASDTTAGRMLVLNHRTAPDLPVVWAVRMSMSIPLLWEEVVWQAGWGQYRGGDMTGHTIVDGGMLSNFPIELFVSHDANVLAVMGEKVSQYVLGLMIDESIPVPGAEAAAAAAPPQFNLGQLRTVQRIGNLINTSLSAHDKAVVEALEPWVIRLPAKGYGTVEFDMSEERRVCLVGAGRATMEAYLGSANATEMVSFEVGAGAPEAPAPAVVPAVAQHSADKVARGLLDR